MPFELVGIDHPAHELESDAYRAMSRSWAFLTAAQKLYSPHLSYAADVPRLMTIGEPRTDATFRDAAGFGDPAQLL